jgi:hypothetical protein
LVSIVIQLPQLSFRLLRFFLYWISAFHCNSSGSWKEQKRERKSFGVEKLWWS